MRVASREMKSFGKGMLAFLGALMLANLAGLTVLHAYDLVTDSRRVNEWTRLRAELPNYPDPEAARQIFEEFNALEFEYEPFVGWSQVAFQGRTTTINSAGDRVHPPARSPASAKAMFFGGSTTWGLGSTDEGTIPARFSIMHPEYEVFNYGEIGFNSRQELARLVNLLSLGEKPGLTVFFDGVNDVVNHCLRAARIPGHGQTEQMSTALKNSGRREALPGQIVDVLFGHLLELSRRVVSRARGLPDPEWQCAADPDHADLVASVLLENWRQAHTLVTEAGGQFVAILQPHAYVGSPTLDHLEGRLHEEWGANAVAVYEALERTLAGQTIPWILDFTNLFDSTGANQAPVYIDGAHLSENGNEMVARTLSNFIENQQP